MTHVVSWTGCDSRQINDLHLKVIPLTPGSRYLFDWNFSTALCLINPASSSDTGANLHFSGRFHSLVCRQQHLVIEDVSKPLLILSSDLLITYRSDILGRSSLICCTRIVSSRVTRDLCLRGRGFELHLRTRTLPRNRCVLHEAAGVSPVS